MSYGTIVRWQLSLSLRSPAMWLIALVWLGLAAWQFWQLPELRRAFASVRAVVTLFLPVAAVYAHEVQKSATEPARQWQSDYGWYPLFGAQQLMQTVGYYTPLGMRGSFVHHTPPVHPRSSFSLTVAREDGDVQPLLVGPHLLLQTNAADDGPGTRLRRAAAFFHALVVQREDEGWDGYHEALAPYRQRLAEAEGAERDDATGRVPPWLQETDYLELILGLAVLDEQEGADAARQALRQLHEQALAGTLTGESAMALLEADR